MNIPVLKVEQRQERGKAPTSRLRRKGLIPAVCYGREIKPLALSLNLNDLLEILRGPLGLNSLLRLEGAEDRMVFVQNLQKDPVHRNILHVDFISIDTNQPIRRKVPVELLGKPEGVKLGGVLQVTSREILVEALPTEIPEKISINVESLLVGQSVHLEDVKFPEGVKAIAERNYSICAIVAPTEEKAPEEVVAEAAAEAAEAEPGAEKPAAEKQGEEKEPAAEKKE